MAANFAKLPNLLRRSWSRGAAITAPKWLCYLSAQKEFAMKRAEAMLEELVRHVRPPRGCALVLTEYKTTGSTDPNWVAASGNMELQKLIRYSEKIAGWRWTDPQIRLVRR